MATLEAVLAAAPTHPLANHMLIHALEASPRPEKADRAADVLRDLQPGLGHLVHMPSHVDVRRGRWQQAIDANAKAITADRSYTARSPDQGFYRLYLAHNHHMLTYGAMMTGQSVLALRTIREMVADMPLEFFRANAIADGFMAMPLEVLMRFGRWEEVLAEAEFPEFVPLSRTLQRYARAVAHAARGDVASGLALLREAAGREDGLRYNEPPDWIQPVRHALGAALLQAGLSAEAEEVFRKDLEKLPENGWSLDGLSRALALQKKGAEAAAVERRFDAVWGQANVGIRSARLCLPGV